MGLGKNRDSRASSLCIRYSGVGIGHDIAHNVNKNNLTVVMSEEYTDVLDDNLPQPKCHIEDKSKLDRTIDKHHEYFDKSMNECSTPSTTVNVQNTDFNNTFTKDFLSRENKPISNLDILNTTFDLEPFSLNKNVTQIQHMDFNKTFAFDDLNTVEKTDDGCFNEFEIADCSHSKARKPSMDDLFNSDDIDDDQQSLDLDESLGILTPNQMKDFTVCIDQQSVIMLDGSISRIPKISSCDNIDDIPEDEVRDTFSHLSNDGDFYTQVLTEGNLGQTSYSPSIHQNHLAEEKTFVKLIHHFDDSIAQDFALDTRRTSTPCTSSKVISEKKASPISFDHIINISNNGNESAKNFTYTTQNKQAENSELNETKTCAATENNIKDKTDDDESMVCSRVELEELPDFSPSLNVTVSSENNDNLNATRIIKQFVHEKNEICNDVIPLAYEENRIVDCTFSLIKDISKDRNNADTTKVISTDVINKQLCFENCELFESEVECLKTERPASTYTVGSTDTGYQEDGDFDVRSELSATTQSPCSELPAHSMYGSNRNMGVEDSERHPVVEIMSDSDFFTDSGGIGFTESEIETDGECKTTNDFTQDNDRMNTVIELNTVENKSAAKKSTSVLDSHVPNTKIMNETLIVHSSPVLSTKIMNETLIVHSSPILSTSIIKEVSEIILPDENDTNKTVSYCKNDETEKSSKVEKINSFIMADNEKTENHCPPEKESISNSYKKVFPNNKTAVKTQPDTSRNKRDNILKAKVQNDNVIAEKKVRKNIVSKIKLMIESPPSIQTSKNDENNPKSTRLPRKSRWEDVTSKIAASMAVDKTKSKEKREIKSRIDTNLLGTKPILSRRGSSKLDSTRNSFPVKNEGASILDTSNVQKLKNLNQRPKIQPPQHNTDLEKNGIQETTIKKNQLKPSKSVSSTLSNASYSSSTSKQSSGAPLNELRSTGIKSNVLKQDMSSTRKASVRLSAAQTAGRTARRDTNWITSQSITNTSQTPATKSSATPVSKNSPTSKTAPISRYTLRDGNQVRKNLPLSQKRPTFPNLDQKRPPLWASKTELSKEVQRLGALCEARTKELNLLKMQLRHAAVGFEAFSVLLRYLTEDLDAFSHPKVALQLKKTKEGLNKTLLQLKEYQDQIEDLKKHHAKEITSLTERLSKVHDDELFDLKMQHTAELAEAKLQHEKKMIEVHKTYEKTTINNEQQYLQIVEELKREYMQQKEEMEKSHAKQLSNAIKHHEETRCQLLGQIKSLQDQYEELLQQAKEMENALHTSSDTKMQWISLKKSELEKEVDSLKVVLEMKQSEIRNLRRENLEMKKELEELPLAKDKIQKLEARREELEAIMEKKSRAQGVLSTEHEQLKEYFEKESKFNKQLSLEKEELQWKLQQSLETTSLLSSLTESSHFEHDLPPFPNRLSASYHAYTSRTSEKDSPHQSVTSSSYRPYRRSASLSDAAISSSKKFRHIWDSPPLTESTKRANIHSHPLLKAHNSHPTKHPKHRSFTLHSGKSFADHKKGVDSFEESVKTSVERKTETISVKNENGGGRSATVSSYTFTSTPHSVINTTLPVHHFELNRAEDTSPIVKLFQNSDSRDGRKLVNAEHSISANNLKLIQMEYEKSAPLQRQVDDYGTKETQPEFVVVLETANNVAAYKANTDQADDGGLEVSKLSDSIEGSFTSPGDILDNSNNVSCSLQSSIISDDSAWSSTSFPPQTHFDVRSQDFVSPSSEDDSFSNSSGGSHGNRTAAKGLNVSCEEQDESLSSVGEHSRCAKGDCRYRSLSPKHLAGEAMVQDDSPVSAAQTSEDLSLSVSCRKHKKWQKPEASEDTNKETWEISCFGIKDRIVQSNNMDSPSMETTSQGHLMTNSNIDDLSWDSEDMPSEPEE